ncbi:MAG: hypothetical protein Kow00105_00670 [Phycisphaeraceae bacterium]
MRWLARRKAVQAGHQWAGRNSMRTKPHTRWGWVIGCLLACLTGQGFSPCAAQLDVVGPLVGDLDGDSFVGLSDLQIVLTHFNHNVPAGDLTLGDPSGDGMVGLDDLTIVLGNWNAGYPIPQQRNLQLGINLSQVNYFNREWVFVDVMKQAKPWVATTPTGNPFDTGETVQTDAKGWPMLQPGQAVHTLMCDGTEGAYPGGRYVCTYEGTGEILFLWDANVVSSSPGRIEMDVTPSNTGILMRITSSSPTDPIRNIRVWMPGFENAPSPFHPLFLQRLSKFKVIRFMDWARTNEATDVLTWADRMRPDHYSQDQPNGVAIEHMIQLCNELDADPWFCMPHTADDAYITNFAALVLELLEPERKVYLEWSNEVWNNRFDVHAYVTQQSGAPTFSPAWFDFWGGRVRNTFTIWERMFAGQEDRLVQVAAGQAANVWVTRKLTERLGDQLDAIACAAYFGEKGGSFDATTTAQDLIQDALNRAIPEVSAPDYQDHGNLADDLSATLGRPIRLLAYEGGQHYADDNRNVPYAQALIDMQYLPEMFSAYLKNMDAFEQAGGDLMLAFNYVDRPGNHGAWGHLEQQDSTLDNAQKFRALLYYIKDH